MVRRRHVIYVQGYDPRGFAEYYRMFRGEFRLFRELYGLSGEVGRIAEQKDRSSIVWPVTVEGRGWKVETTYEFLRWEDIIRRDFARPTWWATLAALCAIIRSMLDLSLFRVFHAHWRFGMFALYPYVLLLGWVLLAAFAGVVVAKLAALVTSVALVPPLLGLAAAAATFIAAIKLTEPSTYMVYLFQDTASTAQYGRRRRPDWEERLQLFARTVADTAKAAAADEIVVVGHSSGSFLAVDVLNRALDLDPDLGRHGPRVVLLTVGANLPIVGFQPGAGWFRERLARLATEPSIEWVDYQARRDIMNFFPFDPIDGHRIKVANRVNPKVVSVQFRDIVTPEKFAWLTWRFFTLHFQFLRANEKPAAYDYFMIATGPFPLATRVAMPADVTAAVAGDDATARAAMERIHSASGTAPRI